MKVKELIEKLKTFEPDEKITLEVYKQDEMPIYITFDDVVYNSVDDNIIEVTICIPDNAFLGKIKEKK